MKLAYLVLAAAFFTAEFAGAQSEPVFSDIVLNADGSVRLMSQRKALDYCAAQGMHLPSAREFAALAESRGAVGASQTDLGNSFAVYHLNGAQEAVVDFYFTIDGYNRPEDLDDNEYWTSSVHPKFPNTAYDFYGYFGVMSYAHRNTPKAVRCAAGL